MGDRAPTVLVTGVGAVIGYGILASLRQARVKCRLVGMDIFDDAYGRHLADDFVQATRADSPDYLPFLASLIERYSIDIVIPGIEQDLYALWAGREQLGTKIVLNAEPCIRLSKDKLATFEFFSERGAPFVIPTLHARSYVECVARLGSPFILKRRSSYASKGQHVIRSASEFEYHVAEAGASRCISQRIVGTDDDEYTVGAFGDGRGSYVDSIILRRRLSQEGATVKAEWVEHDDAIMATVDSIFRTLSPIGPTNVQIRKEEGRAYLLEINPRISSSCSIRTAMGYNEPEMCVRHFVLGETLSVSPKRGGKVVRFIADHVIHER